jgi:hypothetical protein
MTQERAERIAADLRFRLLTPGNAQAGVLMIKRLLARPRLARIVFSSPLCFHLPLQLALLDGEIDTESITAILHSLNDYLSPQGCEFREIALQQLSDPFLSAEVRHLMSADGEGHYDPQTG